MKKYNWLITGGCGFIGSNLTKRLVKDKMAGTIRILDNLCVGSKEDLEMVLSEFGNFREENIEGGGYKYHCEEYGYPVIELRIGDVCNQEAVEKAVEVVDTVVHLAANTGVAPSVANPTLDMESNVVGTFNLLEACRKSNVKQFIFASSSAPIGEAEPPIHEEKAPRPVSPYGASKLAGEGYCSAYYRTFGIKTVSLRFGNVYGPLSKNKNSVVAKFIKQALNGETLEIYGDGNQTRDFIYIDDLIQAIILSINLNPSPHNHLLPTPKPWGEVFQIATFKETTVNEIAEKIKLIVKKETGKDIDVVYGKPRTGDTKRNYSDISKAKKILGYEPRFDLDTGLIHTFEYFRMNGEL